jgi:protein tyrosine phosphatase type IVA
MAPSLAYHEDPPPTYGPNADLSSCIAVHCVAGLGRAPVMVAIALIEFANMDPVEAVSFLRQRRRGAINEKQLLYLEGYKKQYRRSGTEESSCCTIL